MSCCRSRWRRGRNTRWRFEYEGNKVIHDEGGGNFAVAARGHPGIPTSTLFCDHATYDLKFRFPKQYTLVSVGKTNQRSQRRRRDGFGLEIRRADRRRGIQLREY